MVHTSRQFMCVAVALQTHLQSSSLSLRRLLAIPLHHSSTHIQYTPFLFVSLFRVSVFPTAKREREDWSEAQAADFSLSLHCSTQRTPAVVEAEQNMPTRTESSESQSELCTEQRVTSYCNTRPCNSGLSSDLQFRSSLTLFGNLYFLQIYLFVTLLLPASCRLLLSLYSLPVQMKRNGWYKNNLFLSKLIHIHISGVCVCVHTYLNLSVQKFCPLVSQPAAKKQETFASWETNRETNLPPFLGSQLTQKLTLPTAAASSCYQILSDSNLTATSCSITANPFLFPVHRVTHLNLEAHLCVCSTRILQHRNESRWMCLI